jgi:hypothetical protein
MFELSLFPGIFFGNKGVTPFFGSASFVTDGATGNGSTGNSGRRFRRMIGNNVFMF